LTAYYLRLTLQATEALELGPQPGSALRGVLFQGLWERFCMNKMASECSQCPLVRTCPVSLLVAPLREENPRGRDIVRPFVLCPPLIAAEGQRLEAGQSFQFGLTLLGNASALFPYIVMAAQVMERKGLGRALEGNRRRHGQLRIEQIEAVHPFTGAVEPLLTRGGTTVCMPEIAITSADVRARAQALSADHITLHFLSPMRLIAQGRLVPRPDIQVLLLRLAERLAQVQQAYAAEPTQQEACQDKERYQQIKDLAQRCQVVSDHTHWVEVKSYSSRQRRFTPIGGFVGKATFALPASLLLREVLVWGEVFHVGKNTVKGNGWYQIEVC
jgi:hypothetical protein